MPQLNLCTEINDNAYDGEKLFLICWKAFEDAPEIRTIYPGGIDPTYRTENVAKFKMGYTCGPVESYIAKVTEIGSNTISSFISGRIHNGPHGIVDGENGF